VREGKGLTKGERNLRTKEDALRVGESVPPGTPFWGGEKMKKEEGDRSTSKPDKAGVMYYVKMGARGNIIWVGIHVSSGLNASCFIVG